MNVALVYDRVNKWGGAERVLLALHELFPSAPLYTSVYNSRTAPWADVFTVHSSFLQKFPYASLSHEKYAMFMPLSFEGFSFDDYDLVISVTSESAKGIITKPGTKHLCYCLTPTRYLWTGYGDYFKDELLKVVSYPAISYLRYWDMIASRRPDKYVAISFEVQQRIEAYYGQRANVIYPPVDLHTKIKRSPTPSGDYYLVASRLVPYKQIDLAIRACNSLHVPLKIVGVGSELNYLKSIAGPTIEFLGSLTDDDLIGYYRGCRALIFPGREDFGIVIVEAQQYGRPVIAYRAGGALETIIENKTGLFFDNQDTETLSKAISKFETMSFDSADCEKQAEKFNGDRFKKAMIKTIDKFMKNSDH